MVTLAQRCFLSLVLFSPFFISQSLGENFSKALEIIPWRKQLSPEDGDVDCLFLSAA